MILAVAFLQERRSCRCKSRANKSSKISKITTTSQCKYTVLASISLLFYFFPLFARGSFYRFLQVKSVCKIKPNMEHPGIWNNYHNFELKICKIKSSNLNFNWNKLVNKKKQVSNSAWIYSTKHCFERKTIKRIGHHSRLRDEMGQSYPIYACTRANQARY